MAQVSTGPFSTLDVMIGGTVWDARGEFSRLWAPGNGAGVTISTPFYAGRVSAGFDIVSFEPTDLYTRRRTDVPGNFSGTNGLRPSFTAAVIRAGITFRLHVIGPVAFDTGFDTGNFLMMFDESTIKGVRNESEFSTSVFVGPQVRLTKRVFLFGRAVYRRVFTSTPMDLLSIHTGITVRFITPGWLRRVLK